MSNPQPNTDGNEGIHKPQMEGLEHRAEWREKKTEQIVVKEMTNHMVQQHTERPTCERQESPEMVQYTEHRPGGASNGC